MIEVIKKGLSKGVLVEKRQTAQDVYRLQRPIKLVIKANVLAELAAKYRNDYEKGGLLAFTIENYGLVCSKFIEVPNGAKNSVSYNPNAATWQLAIDSILANELLPVAVHTHPTKIGFDRYDSKRSKFYLKSSRADQLVALNGISAYGTTLDMPEAIFVKDERFTGGFELKFYSGTVFPQSTAMLSDLQLAAGGVLGAAALTNSLGRRLLVAGATVFGVDFLRRPKYERKNGDLVVHLGR